MLAIFVLWNQKGTDTGSLLFAGKARSYSNVRSRSKARSYGQIWGLCE